MLDQYCLFIDECWMVFLFVGNGRDEDLLIVQFGGNLFWHGFRIVFDGDNCDARRNERLEERPTALFDGRGRCGVHFFESAERRFRII